jgi:diadenosine tetraphosphatase ApaH/serine/threonine PP2A family protein phosphatase
MLIAILSDIHANREAFDAVMKAAVARGAERFVLLGDLVGYGPDPAYVVEQAAALAGQLSPEHIQFLATLPESAVEDDRLYVHDSAEEPGRWNYVDDAGSADRCLAATGASTVFCGHTHIPAIFYALPGKTPMHYRPLDGIAAPLPRSRRQVVVVGAVGQPRDGNPAACFALLDSSERTVAMVRVPYDCERTAARIEAAGLPPWLGMRLKVGR